MVWVLDQLAERRIQEALSKGQLSDLPGQGQPLLDDDAFVDPGLRAMYRVLRNAGFVPAEVAELGRLELLLQSIASTRNSPQLRAQNILVASAEIERIHQAGVAVRDGGVTAAWYRLSQARLAAAAVASNDDPESAP